MIEKLKKEMPILGKHTILNDEQADNFKLICNPTFNEVVDKLNEVIDFINGKSNDNSVN